MQSKAIAENKNAIVASCWTYFTTFKHVFCFVELIFISPCIVNIIPDYNQQDATFLDLFISTDALHISGGFSAHHQEHTTVHTVVCS